MKRVLIITYYFPPMGGSGVQRWAKFIKYLREFNIEPVVYCPINPEFSLEDDSLLEDIPKDMEIIKKSIFEPLRILNFISGNKTKKMNITGTYSKEGLLKKLLFWIRANLFIPDPRIFWVNPSVRYLKKYLKKNPDIDTVITTSPPHSMNIIGYKLKKKLGIKWIVDFRDPWSEYILETLPMVSKRVLKLHQKLEKKIITKADKVIVTSYELKNLYTKKYNTCNVDVITNGYDEDDVYKNVTLLNNKFTITYTGLLNPDRYNDSLFLAIKELISENKRLKTDLKVIFVGSIDEIIKQKTRDYNLEGIINVLGYVNHKEVMKLHDESSVLLILSEENRPDKLKIEAKLFEYISSGKSILAITHIPSDVSEIIYKTNTGKCFDFRDKEGIKKEILKLYENWIAKEVPLSNKKEIEKYTRKNLTKKIATIINNI